MPVQGMYVCAPCGTSCTTAIGDVLMSLCDLKIEQAKIVGLAISGDTSVSITDVEVLADWTAKIDQTGVDVAKPIRIIDIIGDSPVPTMNTVPTQVGDRPADYTFVLNGSLVILNQKLYDLMLKLQCGNKIKIWYFTEGGYVYGGSTGIETTLTTIGAEYLSADNSASTIKLVATWKSKCSPSRNVSPLDFPSCTNS